MRPLPSFPNREHQRISKISLMMVIIMLFISSTYFFNSKYSSSPFSIYEIIFDRMTKWYLQIDPVFRMSSRFRDMSMFMRLIENFSNDVIKCRKEHLKNIREDFKLEHMEMQEDAILSVIDRFILSGELDKDTLITETFTIFTSVSISSKHY
ncbi:unnamed protein product [Diatraea saccharalis]|uniref:Uncharacterized protein n=1 Tax=Diatraea saccharalis TaxID=40085 RepID=A0A9N9R856_9NEOP|nr:unnamed protein product [Diatraea saccharalis]